MSVVFLDFDGVLVNKKSWYVRSGLQATADPPCIEALNVITRKTGAGIVISSSWRIGQTLAELACILKSWGVAGKLIGKTPWIADKDRGDEISAWLEAYPHPVDRFVILDDDADMGRLEEHLVKTEFDEGLTMEHAQRAIAKLASGAPQGEK